MASLKTSGIGSIEEQTPPPLKPSLQVVSSLPPPPKIDLDSSVFVNANSNGGFKGVIGKVVNLDRVGSISVEFLVAFPDGKRAWFARSDLELSKTDADDVWPIAHQPMAVHPAPSMTEIVPIDQDGEIDQDYLCHEEVLIKSCPDIEVYEAPCKEIEGIYVWQPELQCYKHKTSAATIICDGSWKLRCRLNGEDQMFEGAKTLSATAMRWESRDGSCLVERRGVRPFGMLLKIPSEAVQLGEGAYGVVWRGKAESTGKHYAFKNLPEKSKEVTQRELEMVDRLRLQPHPCVVELYDYQHFPKQKFWCLCMELCSQGDLQAQLVAQHERCAGAYEPPRHCHAWLGQTYLGLAHLHFSANVLIRDLKPQNIVVTEEGLAKIVDFGAGKLGYLPEAGDVHGSFALGPFVGSPGYTAPEVLMQQPYGSKADLYSFAVVMWMLLSGGILGEDGPHPPCDERYSYRRDPAVLVADWTLLQKSFEKDKLQPEARSLLQQVITGGARERLGHRQIRESAFFKEVLQLPRHLCSETAIQDWVLQIDKATC